MWQLSEECTCFENCNKLYRQCKDSEGISAGQNKYKYYIMVQKSNDSKIYIFVETLNIWLVILLFYNNT